MLSILMRLAIAIHQTLYGNCVAKSEKVFDRRCQEDLTHKGMHTRVGVDDQAFCGQVSNALLASMVHKLTKFYTVFICRLPTIWMGVRESWNGRAFAKRDHALSVESVPSLGQAFRKKAVMMHVYASTTSEHSK